MDGVNGLSIITLVNLVHLRTKIIKEQRGLYEFKTMIIGEMVMLCLQE